MNKTTLIAMIALVITSIFSLNMINRDNRRIDREKTEEVLKIEKDIKQFKIYPDRETIDRLYRYRNSVDSKYSFEGPSKEFIEAYDRVIKPL